MGLQEVGAHQASAPAAQPWTSQQPTAGTPLCLALSLNNRSSAVREIKCRSGLYDRQIHGVCVACKESHDAEGCKCSCSCGQQYAVFLNGAVGLTAPDTSTTVSPRSWKNSTHCTIPSSPSAPQREMPLSRCSSLRQGARHRFGRLFARAHPAPPRVLGGDAQRLCLHPCPGRRCYRECGVGCK